MNAEERSDRLLALVERIADALERAYPPLAAPPPKPVSAFKCPACGGPMKLRLRRTDHLPFYGCLRYPECKGTRNEDGQDSQNVRRVESLADTYEGDGPTF